MRVAIAADEHAGVATVLEAELARRDIEALRFGLFAKHNPDWAPASEAAARAVKEGRADFAIVCCWTGTGASIAANKVPGIRAALCGDAETARGARQWNDANVLALSNRLTSEVVLREILDAWLATTPSADDEETNRNLAHLQQLEQS